MIDRRRFVQSLGLAGVPAVGGATATAQVAGGSERTAGTKTWLFWDLWHLDELTGAELRQGQAEWRPEGFSLVTLHEFLPTQHLFVFEAHLARATRWQAQAKGHRLPIGVFEQRWVTSL